jgi:hypothetical protein
MAKPKTSNPTKTKVSKEIAAPEDVDDEPLSEVADRTLTAADTAFLRRVSTLLFQVPQFARRAETLGYTPVEHALGWRLYTTAGGGDVPLSYCLGEQDQSAQPAEISAERSRILQEIDTFENKWFPRIRMIIPRVIPKKMLARFTAAFFKDLSQQPLGPTVVGSVKTLLNRVEALKDSSEAGAKELAETLLARGLTPKKIASMRELLAAAEQQKPVDTSAPPSVSPKDVAKAKEAQFDALDALKLWYNDWATTFRDSFGLRDQITMGLTAPRQTQTKAGEVKGGEEDEGDDQEDEGDDQEDEGDDQEDEGDEA